MFWNTVLFTVVLWIVVIVFSYVDFLNRPYYRWLKRSKRTTRILAVWAMRFLVGIPTFAVIYMVLGRLYMGFWHSVIYFYEATEHIDFAGHAFEIGFVSAVVLCVLIFVFVKVIEQLEENKKKDEDDEDKK